MAAVNYRFPKETVHQAQKSTVVMTVMKAKFFSPIGALGIYEAAIANFYDIA
jgi:hypothetical protein